MNRIKNHCCVSALNDLCPQGLSNKPWQHLVLDDFLSEAALTKGLSEVGEDDYTFEMEQRGSGRIEFSLLQSETFWRSIYCREVMNTLSVAFGVNVRLNRHNMLQVRRMNDETPEFPLHSDFVSDKDTIVSFLYISRNWKPDCGGLLRLYASDQSQATSVAIAPKKNRFVAFRTSRDHWHSVDKVRNWNRYSIMALWDID